MRLSRNGPDCCPANRTCRDDRGHSGDIPTLSNRSSNSTETLLRQPLKDVAREMGTAPNAGNNVQAEGDLSVPPRPFRPRFGLLRAAARASAQRMPKLLGLGRLGDLATESMRAVRMYGKWNGLAASLRSGYRHLPALSMTRYRHDIIVSLSRPSTADSDQRRAVQRLSGCYAHLVMIGAAFNLTLAMFSSEGATAAQNAWIVTHSRETLVEAMDLGISIEGSVELPVQVCRAKNGKYFAALGPGPSGRLKKRKDQYVASGVIPSDAFITQTCYPVEQIEEPDELPALPLIEQISLFCRTVVRCSVVKGSGWSCPCLTGQSAIALGL